MFYDKEYSMDFAGRQLKVRTNVAQQAHGSCWIEYGETSTMAASTMSTNETVQDFFPLTVEYQERFYAAGKILGSRFTRREGRGTNKMILTGRLIDRIIRPLFPESFTQETQVILTTLSWDAQNAPVFTGALSASLSLGISKIPWNGPIACVQVGSIDGEFVLNPSYEQLEKSNIKLTLGGYEKNGQLLINMIECISDEVSEEVVAAACKFANPYLKQLIDFQKKIMAECGQEKYIPANVFPEADMEQKIREFLGNKLDSTMESFVGKELMAKLEELKKETIEAMKAQYPDKDCKKLLTNWFERELDYAFHKLALEKGKRADGRAFDELRELTGKVAVLPRAHGSGFFARGQTQALSICTLGAPGDQQLLEDIDFQGKKRYMHHYNFPPYCSGEVKRLGAPGRREIGHGQLAENALIPLIPDVDQFPYTIRVVTEIMSSNGSTSMASVCGSTLSLMDAGVPLKRPCAGISIGLMHGSKLGPSSTDERFKLLTDIQGPEDHYGDMDFKVAGTSEGITAIQLDVKLDGLTQEIIEGALSAAKTARTKILGVITATIAEPRKELSPYAPVIVNFQINPEKIGEVIGPKGKTINEIVAKYEVTVDIEDDGKVFVTGTNKAQADAAIEAIKSIVKEFQVGEIIKGKVVNIMDFGAFVELSPSTDGLIHISNLANHHVAKVTDVVKEGDVVDVKIIGIEDNGKIKLSLKDLTPGAPAEENFQARERAPRFNPRGRGPGRGDDRRGPRRH